jgi:arylsulfatase A
MTSGSCSHGVAVLLALTACVAARAATEQRPNIVYILADDMGYGDVRCYNPECKVPTPSIDRLASEGIRFTDAHSGAANCSPTRYGILTGRYSWRTRMRSGVLAAYDPPLIADGRLTVPLLLKQHGYRTACIGKWHLGWDWPRRGEKIAYDQPLRGGPISRGFDYFFGMHLPNIQPYCFIENGRILGELTATSEKLTLNGEPMLNGAPGPMVPGWKFDAILPTITEKAVRYLAEAAQSSSPFFLYFPLTSPHTPIAPSPRFLGKSGISTIADLMMETDWAVGEVLDALEKHGFAKNTIVFFATDNGHEDNVSIGSLIKAGHSVSGPFRGYKRHSWEGGHRVPFVVRWPGVVKPGTVSSEPICLSNLVATCAEIFGDKLPANAAEDSFSILPLLKGEVRREPTHPAIVHQASNGTLALRQGRWKVIMGELPAKGEVASPDKLLDLESDPGETRDVASQHPEIVERLRKTLAATIENGRSTPGPAQKNDGDVPLRIKLKPGAPPSTP